MPVALGGARRLGASRASLQDRIDLFLLGRLVRGGTGGPRGDRLAAQEQLLDGLRPAQPDDRLPELPDVNLLLLKAREPRQPVTDVLYAHILETFEVKIDPQ